MSVKLLAVIAAVATCSLGLSATITVTSPAKGTEANPTLVGATTSLQLRLSSMSSRAEVTAKVTRLDGSELYTLDTEVEPDGDLNGTGSIPLAFATGTSEEVYKIEVRARDLNDLTTYNADQNLFVLPDLTKPKFLSYTPLNGSFVKGTVLIRARIDEPNLRDWRVQVDGKDIPGNTGTTLGSNGEFSVSWNASAFTEDGAHTVNIRVRDRAGNDAGRTVNVTVDRISPTVTIQSPKAGTVFAPGTTVTVVVDIKDASPLSVNETGVDVVVRDAGGTFVTRVARASFRIGVDGTLRWMGRISWRPGVIPSPFTVVATAVDRAGNASTSQSVTCSYGG